MNRLLIALIACSVIGAAAQSQLGPDSPRDVVDQVWKRATEGELLRADGWSHASQFYLQHDDFPVNSPVRIVSNYWGVEHSSVSNNTAEVDLAYTDAGTVDASLKYSPPPRAKYCKTGLIFRLVFAPTHRTMIKSDGTREERPSYPDWQIKEPIGLPWTTVNTAIRYVLEKREKTTDPVIRKNADETLARLLKWH
jgi:hypothetical protein